MLRKMQYSIRNRRKYKRKHNKLFFFETHQYRHFFLKKIIIENKIIIYILNLYILTKEHFSIRLAVPGNHITCIGKNAYKIIILICISCKNNNTIIYIKLLTIYFLILYALLLIKKMKSNLVLLIFFSFIFHYLFVFGCFPL